MSTIVVRSRLLSTMVLIAAVSSRWATAETAPSGGQRIVHESWTFKDGAPPTPTALMQTADGYLWVGASAGLFRFDGVRFELFRSPFGDRLQSTNVSRLFAADDGLWVGYVFGGFSFLKNGRVKNFVEPTSTVTGFAADPLACRQCGGKLKVIAYVTDEISVKRILAGLGLSPPEEEKPPPIRDVARVPLDDEGREIQAT